MGKAKSRTPSAMFTTLSPWKFAEQRPKPLVSCSLSLPIAPRTPPATITVCPALSLLSAFAHSALSLPPPLPPPELQQSIGPCAVEHWPTWLLTLLCWLTPVPPVTTKQCQAGSSLQALCPLWVMMSENFYPGQREAWFLEETLEHSVT